MSLRLAASPRWAVAGGKQHIRAGARVVVPVPMPVQTQVQVQVVRAQVPVC